MPVLFCFAPYEAQMETKPNPTIIRARPPRDGWDEAFRRMAEGGDDVLEDEAVSLTAFDEAEWTW
jgi:antitoxin MazE